MPAIVAARDADSVAPCALDYRVVIPITGSSVTAAWIARDAGNSAIRRRLRNCSFGACDMSDRDTFGPRLRAARERRGISLETLSSVTNVHTELWEGLERGDLSRWPSGIFARSFIRYYARALSLDEDEVVNEFCRHFPQGDRRRRPLIVAQAELIGHAAAVPEDAELPPQGERRARPVETAPTPAAVRRGIIAPRALATLIDLFCVVMAGSAVSLLLPVGFFAATGCVTLAYYGLSTVTLGSSAGMRIVQQLQRKVPELFVETGGRSAHA
jgi:transcriptional regulator with XRE-family HTH domain